MSTFGGIMSEYPYVVIDRFVGSLNMKANAYFLSHAHTDHMVGLGSCSFSERLKQGFPNVHLYCSVVTKLLLLKDDRFQHLQPYIECLPIDQPTTIVTENQTRNESLIVTLLPAGHCPGSVMFLFEGNNGIVLYTGDFRLGKGDAALMRHLHSGSSIKDIKCVYADTTFCTPMAMHIPSREQSLGCLLDLIDRHISKSDKNQVKLVCKAKYGYEYLFVELSKAFNMKVHVSPYMMMHYQVVPELASHMTSDGTTTQIHACGYVKCSVTESSNTIIIKPSTMWFTSHAKPDEILKTVSDTYYRLCFSFHSSYSEIRDFIGYLKPWEIKPNVVPMKCTEQEIIDLLSDLLRIPVSSPNKSSLTDEVEGYKPLGSLKIAKRRRFKEKKCSIEYDSLFGESCPRLKKRKSSVEQDLQRSDEGRKTSPDGRKFDLDNQASQSDLDDMDSVISETGSDKVMKFGWNHFNDGLVDDVSTDTEREDEGERNTHEVTDCHGRYGLGGFEKNPNKFDCHSNHKVSDWLQYLPSTFSESVNKTSVPENKCHVGEESKLKRSNGIQIVTVNNRSLDKKQNNVLVNVDNPKSANRMKITNIVQQEIKLTDENLDINAEDDSQRTEEYSLGHVKSDADKVKGQMEEHLPNTEVRMLPSNTTLVTMNSHSLQDSDNIHKLKLKPVSLPSNISSQDGIHTTVFDLEPKHLPANDDDVVTSDYDAQLTNNPPSRDAESNPGVFNSELKHILLPLNVSDDVTSDDDLTYVSGQLSQGNSDVPGTPDSKVTLTTQVGSTNMKDLSVSRVYKMTRRSFINQ